MSDWQYSRGGNPFSKQQEQVPIMPRTERNFGDANPLLNLFGSSALAAANMTPIGRGMTGAVGTMMAAPTDSDAGLLAPMGKVSRPGGIGRLFGAKGPGLVDDGKWVMGGNKYAEIPTNTPMKQNADIRYKDERFPYTGLNDIREETLKSNMYKNLNPNEQNIMNDQLSEIENLNPRVSNSDNHEYFGENPNVKGLHSSSGDIHVRSLGPIFKDPEVNVFDFMRRPIDNVVDHEFQHGLQDVPGNPLYHLISDTDKMGYRNTTPYENRLFETEARMAGDRARFSDDMMTPGHKFGVHPMLSLVGRGKIGTHEAENYLKQAVKAKTMNKKEAKEVFGQLKEEKSRLMDLYSKSPEYKKQYDEAFEQYGSGLKK